MKGVKNNKWRSHKNLKNKKHPQLKHEFEYLVIHDKWYGYIKVQERINT